MKKAFGLILFLTSFPLLASGILILRGRVPASYHVEIDQQNQQGYSKFKDRHVHWKIVGNGSTSHGGPKISVKHSKSQTLVSVIHP